MNGTIWLLLAVHVSLCLFLVLLVLIQNDKGGGLAGAFGGMGGGAAFSGTGAATFISKLTRWVAFAFMAGVLGLNVLVANLDGVKEASALKKAAVRESGLGHVLPAEEKLNIDSTLKLPE